MRVWMLQKNGTLEEQDRPEKVTEALQIKARVSKVLLTESDKSLMLGRDRSAIFPIIPGRAAVGVVSESCDCGIDLPKGSRVYLHPIFSCGVCENCKKGDSYHCTDVKITGYNAHGFLREFAVVNINDVTPLPSSVSDETALYVEWIAIAESVLDTLECSKGEHIVILGAGLLGNLLAQLLIYRRIVPILIDSNEELLNYAKRCGIYYTFKTDETLYDNVSRVTGGRLAEASVHITDSGIDPSLLFSLTAPRANVVYAGFGQKDLTVNLHAAMQKSCTIHCVTGSKKHIPSAINLLANKAITIPDFRFTYGTPETFLSYVRETADSPVDFRNPYIIKLL